MIDRRTLALVAGAAALAGCSQTDWANIEAQLASVITQVQRGVREACDAAGTFVPAADTVLLVLIQIIGSATVQGVTAAVIKEAIDAIAAVCPAAPALGRPLPSLSAPVKGKNIPIVFY